LRKANNELKKAAKENKKRYEELEMFAGVVSHDMKSPLANIVLTVDTLKKKVENSTTIDDTIKVYLDYIKTSSMSMNQYIEGILEYYKSDHTSDDEIEFIKLRPFLKRIIDMLNAPDTFKIKLPKKGIKVHVNKTAFGQIILNLVANSIKYCDKEKPVVNIEYKEDEKQYMFMIKDNGPGIKEEDQDKIFELFNNLNAVDRNGQRGTGIGLATVKKLVEGLEGEINICSTLGEGTTFTVIIPKPYEMTVIV
jgi:signal transduction histidine kinase